MSIPHDVVVARSLVSLRNAMLATFGAALVLGVFELAIVLLAARPGSPVLVWPGLSTLLVGQAFAVAAGIACFAGLTGVLRAPERADSATGAVAAALRRVGSLLPAALVVASAAWIFHSPGAVLQAFVCGLVAAQVVLICRLARRSLTSD